MQCASESLLLKTQKYLLSIEKINTKPILRHLNCDCAHREADRARDRTYLNSGDRLTEKIIDAEIEKDEAVRERMATHIRIK